ncbi:MAG: TolC family protein [Bacteroidia bacterium]|nr:TolC family protein [Bacteroidia bacterium]
MKQKQNQQKNNWCVANSWLVLLLAPLFSTAQSDTILTFSTFYNQVMAYHPIVKQGKLLPEQAKMELRSARGGFDPVIDVDYRNKTSNSKNSYTYFTPELKVPTRIGIDVKGGLEMSSGTNINPEQGKIDASGLVQGYNMWYGGVSVPIGRGLVFDDRRAALRQAQLFQTLAQAEQIKLINKLLLTAAKEYWDWQQSYEVILWMRTNVELAKNRLEFVNNRISSGEEKPIDSVEASIEYNRREVMLAEAELFFKNASLQLSNYLWNENSEPLQLRTNIVPSRAGLEIQQISNDSLQRLVTAANTNHPELVKLTTKIGSLDIERKLAVEMLKPRLTFDYIPFRTYTNGASDGVDAIWMNNYKFGVSFYSSLFLRKERGKLAATKFKIKQNEYELQFTQRQLVNEVLASYNELQNLEKLLAIQTTLVNNAMKLRDAEEVRFENGESSLFLVNMRERSLIEAQIKMAELNAKYAKAKIQLQWSSGVQMFN